MLISVKKCDFWNHTFITHSKCDHICDHTFIFAWDVTLKDGKYPILTFLLSRCTSNFVKQSAFAITGTMFTLVCNILINVMSMGFNLSKGDQKIMRLAFKINHLMNNTPDKLMHRGEGNK